MIVLDKSERACLQSIAQGHSDTDTACPTHTLHLLESLELIEQIPRIRLPWLLERGTYRLTALGRRILEQQ